VVETSDMAVDLKKQSDQVSQVEINVSQIIVLRNPNKRLLKFLPRDYSRSLDFMEVE
jgi:hypothetical protein